METGDVPSIYNIAEKTAKGNLSSDEFAKAINEIDLSNFDGDASIADIMHTIYSNTDENKELALNLSKIVIDAAEGQGIDLTTISYTSLTNIRSHGILKHLIDEKRIDPSKQNEDGGKTIFSGLMEQGGGTEEEVASDRDFLQFLVQRNCVRGLENGLGDLLLHALEPRNHHLLPTGNLPDFKKSFGTRFVYNEDGIISPLVNLFSNQVAVEDLLSSYIGGDTAALRDQLNATYHTFDRAAVAVDINLALPPHTVDYRAKSDSDEWHDEQIYHTPDRKTESLRERKPLSPNRAENFHAISPTSGAPKEEPSVEVKASRGICERLCGYIAGKFR